MEESWYNGTASRGSIIPQLSNQVFNLNFIFNFLILREFQSFLKRYTSLEQTLI